MKAPLLEIRELSIELPAGSDRPRAVHGLSLELAAGEILCVVGASGSGKSMLANAILRLLPPPLSLSAGCIRWRGHDLATYDEAAMRRLRGRDIAIVFQDPLSALNPLASIGQQLDETLRAHGQASRSERRCRIIELLGYVGLPDPPRLYHAYPFQLSGGQRQRVVIAMALALEPALLIADEPTSALDASTQAQLLELLERIRRERDMAVLLITHDFAVVEALADRVLVMEQGQAVEHGPLEQVLTAPRHPYTRSLLEALYLPPRQARALRQQAAPLLDVQNLHKTYGSHSLPWRRRRVKALDDVGFILGAGESLGIVGESGSGKTTLGRALVRLLRPDAGQVLLQGQDLAALSQARLRPLRGQIQMIFQDPYASLNPRQRIGVQIMAGPLAQGVSRVEAAARARQLLVRVGLPEGAFERYPREFSGGQRQRIGIARALAVQPRVLVADECVSALDALVQRQVLELLEELQRDLGLALIFITHDLRVAARLCDRLAVMQGGRIVELGETGQVLEAPRHAYTRALLAARRAVPAPGADRLPHCFRHPTDTTQEEGVDHAKSRTTT